MIIYDDDHHNLILISAEGQYKSECLSIEEALFKIISYFGLDQRVVSKTFAHFPLGEVSEVDKTVREAVKAASREFEAEKAMLNMGFLDCDPKEDD